ncbi:MAG: NHLP family bacteriocin export ABC transporter peptidase/permease/ATPase subunit [Clostridia bacterium]|nr:NHLP family bacteriocin export ABC transporter peptidase/permease/ATPase subunit [Clostridia bacterium]
MSSVAKTPTVFQMEFTECGAASLAMVLAYFGRNVSLEQMRVETGVSRDGCNAANIMKAAKKFGVDCKGFRKEPEDLRGMEMPCILHWNFNHFVVLEGFSGNKVFINDPALGRRKLTFEELDDAFTGVVLTFRPNESFVKEKRKDGIGDFIKEHISQRRVLFKLVFIGLLLVFPGLITSVLSKVFTDEILVKHNTDMLSKIIILVLVSSAAQIILSFYRGVILVKLQKKVVLLSTRDFLYKMFRLPISFFDQRNAGDLCGRVANNAQVSDFLSGDLAGTVLNLLVAVFYLILLFIYSWELTLIAIAAVTVNILIMKFTSDYMANSSIKYQQDSCGLVGALNSGLNITDSIKASGAETEYIGKILGYNAKAITTEQKLNKSQNIIIAIPGAVDMLANVIILLVGGVFVINNKMTMGMLTAFTALYGTFSNPVGELVGFVKKIQATKADIRRVEDIENYKSDDTAEQPSVRQKFSGSKLEGKVELRNVSFGYSPLKPPIVSNFSFDISCGSSIAFVGPSGSGKSTVSKIVSGLYKPWSGELLFDETPAGAIPKDVINASVSTVSQQITLFSGSIRDNLTMWNTNIFESDIIEAAKDACIHDFISQKPGGYDYLLTEGASNLSGGQRQRLEIARALVTNPTVLIMDEATSALDPITEKKILDNIKRRGCTCVIVAHRLSAIRDCDQIIVMHDGRIIQRGTHDELSACEGLYSEFIKNN